MSRYLQEVGYTDTILDVRSSRVRSILGLSAPPPEVPQVNGTPDRQLEDDSKFEDELETQHPRPIHIRQPVHGGHEIINPTPVRRYDMANK